MDKNTKKTASETYLQSTKKVFLILVLALFSMGFASALEFDNIKAYDETTKTATIVNAFGLGGTIAEVQLKSELKVEVGLGYQKVFEYEINSLTDYKDFIQDLEIYNKNNNNALENKQIDLKYLVNKEVEEKNFTYNCDKDGRNCKYVDLGTYKVNKDVWVDLPSEDLKVEKMIISGWTNVNQGDYYEWIPNFAGIKVEEWATWSGNISTNILSYWRADGNYTDELGANSGTNQGTANVTGKIRYGWDFEADESDYINLSRNTIDMTDGNFTLNMWVKPESSGNPNVVFSSFAANGYSWNIQNGRTLAFGKNGVNEVASTDKIANSVWSMITVVYDTSANTIQFYINGTVDSSGTDAYTSTFDANLDYMLGRVSSGLYYDGLMDEVGVWTRALSSTEITLLYNEGLGCQYNNETCFIRNVAPTVTLTSPIANYNSTSKTIQLICKGVDDGFSGGSLQNVSLILNTSYNGTNVSVFNNSNTSFSRTLADGYYSWNCNACDSGGLCANGTAQYFWINTQPSIYIHSPPANNSNYTTRSVYINASSSLAVDEWKLNVNGTNYTITINSSFTFNADGTYRVLLYGRNSDSGVYGLNNTRYLTINTSPSIYIHSPPANNSNYTTSNVYINASSSLGINEWKLNYNGTNYTITINQTFAFTEGTHRLLLYGRNSESGIYGLNNTRYLSIDTVNPTILVTGGNGTQTYGNISSNHTLNITFTDTNLDDCWINYNGTNRTFSCSSGVDSPVNFTLQFNVFNATIWANDTFGLTTSRFVEWDYRFLFMNQSYTTPVLEGVSSTFNMNLYTNGSDITIAWFNYNGTNSYGTVTDNGNDFFTVSISRTAPTVSADSILPFYWILTQGSLGNYTFGSNNQTVTNVGIDNCSINGNVLYNFTMVDEELQTEVNETGSSSYAEINLQLYAYGTSTLVGSYSTAFNQTNPFAICFNNSFDAEKYNINLQLRYKATNYSDEYYHMQNGTIQNSSFTTFINLYDLDIDDAQVFKLSVKNSYYLPVKDALIYVYRKYISEDAFKVSEIPKTDDAGETTASLVVNDVIYSFLIVKNNEVLASFNNTIPVCQTPLVSPCVIEFALAGEAANVPDFYSERDFNFTLGYNKTSRVISSYFDIPSGDPATILLVVTTEDIASTSVCTDTLTSNTGTLTCSVPNTIGNTTVRATLYRNGLFQSFGTVRLDDNFSTTYSGLIILLSVIVLLTLAGIGLTNSPIVTAFFLGLSLIFIFAINLVPNKGFIGSTATILLILIAIVILLIKGVRRS